MKISKTAKRIFLATRFISGKENGEVGIAPIMPRDDRGY